MPKLKHLGKKLVSIAEAKAQLSRLIARVERGEEIWIGRYGRVVAKLVPPGAPPSPSGCLGFGKGRSGWPRTLMNPMPRWPG